MTDTRPVGIFDSGVGGLTVLRAIHDLLPHESTLYVGDVGHFPYGPKPREVVQERALLIRDYLADHDIKVLVIACNTATSAALEIVREGFEVPVIGVVEPGAITALARSRSKIIGAVATEGTVRSAAYSRSLRSLDPEVEIHEIPCGRLVDLVQNNEAGSDEANSLVTGIVERLAGEMGCDTIILGCTHYPLVRSAFERAAGPRVAIVDSAASTATALREHLFANDIMAPDDAGPVHSFQVTAQADGFRSQATMLFGEHIEAELVEIESAALAC